MGDNEKQFEKFIRGIKFDDSPDREHRDKLEQDLLNALAKQEGLKRSPLTYEKLKTRLKTSESFWPRTFANPLIRKVAFQLTEVAAIVALTLSVSHWLGFPRSKVLDKPVPAVREDSTIINLYLKEHQGVVAQTAALNLSTPPAARMHVSRDDLLYYEFLDEWPEFTRPGIIVRGPLSERQVIPSEAPAISNGQTLTLSEARKTANFELVAPPRLYPGYMLDKIRRIEGRDTLHLLYTNGIDTISLFEQPLEAERGLGAHDFRQYAVYCNEGQGAGTILAWKDDALCYVLVGNAEMSQLMDMAQSISAAK